MMRSTLLLDELFGVADGGGAVVAVVEDEEIDADGGGGGLETFGHLDGEGHLGALTAEAEAELLRAGDVAIRAVGGLRDIAAVDEGFEDAVDGGLGDPGLCVNGLEGHGLIFGSEAARGCRAPWIEPG